MVLEHNHSWVVTCSSLKEAVHRLIVCRVQGVLLLSCSFAQCAAVMVLLE